MPKKLVKTSKSAISKKSPKTRKKQVTDAPQEIASFANEIEKFVLEVESLARATHQTTKVTSKSLVKATEDFQRFIKDKGASKSEHDGTESYTIKPHELSSLKHHLKDMTASALAVAKIPQIFFCSLIHQYDAYLGNLLHVAFYVKPEILNASDKQLTFSELIAFPSMDAAREYLIEKEIETVIRDSHVAHFDWMENRFGLSLRKDLSVWPQFVEMAERRNLFVHADGVISSQYLKVCERHNVKFEKPVKSGQQLGVTQEYFDQSVECIIEIGVKLGHVLWRKLMPDNLQDADCALHRVTYDLLLDERYSLAKTLLHFTTNTLKKHSSDEIRRINLINLAIAHSGLGEKEEATRLLDGHDWSACESKFKLGVAVLHQNYAEAAKIMRKIGNKGDVSREEYSSWPLFQNFRKSAEFLQEYKALFGEDFVVPLTHTDQRLEVDKISQQNA